MFSVSNIFSFDLSKWVLQTIWNWIKLGSGPLGFNWWVSLNLVCCCIYCLVLIFVVPPFYILICMYYEKIHWLGRDLSCELNINLSWSTSVIIVRLVPSKMFKPLSIFTDQPKVVLLLYILFCYLCFMFACNTVLFVPCSLVVTCWERADLLVLLYVLFSCVFVTFPYSILGQVWYLIVSIPDICLLPYFYEG